MVYLIVGYIVVGVVVYGTTNTLGVASKLERALVVVPYGVIQKNLFLFIVALWPFWLVVRARAGD
jgi:hypothetical protein